MSIAYEINRLQTSKADTKEQVNIDKDYINAGIDFIGSETVDGYDEKIQEMQEAYKAFIPVNTTSDTQIDVPKGGTIIGKALKGNTSQSGTPTPSAPVVVENATGLQKIKVTKKNLFDVSTLVNKSYNGASSSTRVCNSQAIYLTPGTYTFSTNINTSTYKFKTDVLKNPPTSPITESYVYNSGFGTSNPRTITITSPGYFAILIKKNDDTAVNDFTLKEFTYQLEKGSSATTYEEYQDTTLYMNYNKNLLKINDTSSKTINGITFTENSDGSIHAEGTATDLALYGTNTLLPIIPSQRYRLSGCPEGGSLSSYYISIMLKNESGSGIGSFADIGDGLFGDFIAPDSARYMYAQILILSGTTINATFYPQLELGSEITSYKQYEPLQEGNYEINLKSKNLLIQNRTTTVVSGVTFTINEDGSVTCNGTATDQYCVFDIGRNTGNILPSGTYVASGIQGTGSNETYRIAMWKNVNGTVTNINVILEGSKSFSLTENAEVFYRIIIANGYTVENLTFYPMIEQGSTATDYTSYYNIELNKIGNYQDFIRKGTGKNLFDSNSEIVRNTFDDSGLNYTQDNGIYVLNGTNTKSYVYIRYDVNLPKGTYTLSGCPTGGSLNGYSSLVETTDGSYFDYGSGVTFTIDTDQVVMVYPIRIGNSTITANNLVFIPMLETGSSATYYEPYGYKDKWYIEKNVLKLVVPDAVTGTLQNSNKRFYVNGIELGTSNILKNTQSSKTYGLYCDILEEKTAGQTWNGTQGISYDYNSGQNRGCLDFAISGLTTVAEYQNALKGKAIYAIANTPEYTLIENEDLIEQLEKIMPLLEGQNNISVDGSIPVYMDLDYIVRADRYLIGNRREGK